MRDEIQRSRGIVSEAGLAEYEQALAFYRSLEVVDDADEVAGNAGPLTEADRESWLRNMIVDHRFTAEEVRLASGLSIEEAKVEIDRLSSPASDSDPPSQSSRLAIPGRTPSAARFPGRGHRSAT